MSGTKRLNRILVLWSSEVKQCEESMANEQSRNVGDINQWNHIHKEGRGTLVVANRATQDIFLSHKRIWISNFYIPFFYFFWDLKNAMDCFICHCFSQINKNLCLLCLFLLFWDLKKAPWIALLSTANFEQVIIISHFDQVKKTVVILLTLNKS